MTRSIPPRPHLDSDRKRAKALKRALASRNPDAVSRVREFHPRYREAASDLDGFRLSDAQLVIAREYGVESWPRWVAIVGFLRADFEQRALLFLEAAIGEHPKRAHDLLAMAPELAGANLQTACAALDERAVREQLQRSTSAALRADGVLSATPLWTLCWSNLHWRDDRFDSARVRIAQSLLDAGADPNADCERDSSWGRHRFTALYGATRHERTGLVEKLLEAGAQPDDGESLYHATEHEDDRCLALLLQHGARVAGTNALLRALDHSNLSPVRALLEAGADPAERGPGGRNALHHAAWRGRKPTVVDWLLERGAPLDERDGDGRTAYQLAVRHGYPRVAGHLASRGASDEVSSNDRLVAALFGADPRAAGTALAQCGVPIERLDDDDLATLPRAAARGMHDAVSMMLDFGLPLETLGAADWPGTALNHAAYNGHHALVSFLLERGADPEIENDFGGTALGAVAWASLNGDRLDGSAADRQRDLARCAEVLCVAGARVMPKHLANAEPMVAEAMLRYGG